MEQGIGEIQEIPQEDIIMEKCVCSCETPCERCPNKNNEEEEPVINVKEFMGIITKAVFYNNGKNERTFRIEFVDGTTSTTSCLEGDAFSEEAGVAIGLCKALFGGYTVIDKILEKAVRVDNVPNEKKSTIGFTGMADKSSAKKEKKTRKKKEAFGYDKNV